MTTKSFNQAFLRAFSKDGQPGVRDSSRAPLPCSESSTSTADNAQVSDSDAATFFRVDTPLEAERVSDSEDAGRSLRDLPEPRVTEPSDGDSDPATGSIPAPHFSTPAEPVVADAETVVNDVEAVAADAEPVLDREETVEADAETAVNDAEAVVADAETVVADAETVVADVLETETRETWIISDLNHHARLLETMPLLVIPTTNDDEWGWLPSTEFPPTQECAQESAEESGQEIARESAQESDGEPGIQPETTYQAESEVDSSETIPHAATMDSVGSVETPADRPEPVPCESERTECDDVNRFDCAWEVDHLGWTSVCRELYESEAQPFAQAGQQLFTATAEGLRVLAITSAYRGEGRTTLALLLARSAAEAGVRVAVMDADLDNPQLALNARLQPASDWRRALDDESSLEEAAIHAVEERITLFPLEPQSRGEPLRLSDPRVTKLVHGIAARFDLLIIDMGPIANDDRRLFAGGKICPLDAAVVVRDLRYTTDDQATSVVQRLMDLGVEAVGIAENFVREPLEMSA